MTDATIPTPTNDRWTAIWVRPSGGSDYADFDTREDAQAAIIDGETPYGTGALRQTFVLLTPRRLDNDMRRMLIDTASDHAADPADRFAATLTLQRRMLTDARVAGDQAAINLHLAMIVATWNAADDQGALHDVRDALDGIIASMPDAA